MTFLQGFFLVVAHFVCPLIFFTNLTRNPYVAQIGLLNISLAAAAAIFLLRGPLSRKPLQVPRTPLDAPWLGTLAVCALSWSIAYFGHVSFFRPAIVNEGLRNGVFLLVNSLVPFYLAASLSWEDGESKPSILPWVVFISVWGLLWLPFPQMRAPQGSYLSLWLQAWDGYGALLWLVGLIGAAWLCRRARAQDFLHLALAVGFLASLYGVCQYFNCEFIWPNALNPYGGRCVSTFGNPNFLSSYNVILLPICAVGFIESRSVGRRLACGVVFLTLEAALLCSMTRSSWAGAVVALLLLPVSRSLRRQILQFPRPCGLLAAAGLAMVLFWPQSSIATGYAPSVVSRLVEVGQIARPGASYSPWYQRVLIWTCAWLMGAENPFTGKGWGLFELFYPFYQGPLLNALDMFRSVRTHANNAHNEIMEIWAQTGLLGLGAFCWMWTTFSAAVVRRRALLARHSMALAAAAAVAGVLVDNLLNVSIHFAVPGFLFWWAAGSALGASAPRKEERWHSVAGPAIAKVLAMTAVILAGAASWNAVRFWNREARYFTGFKLLHGGETQRAVEQLEASRRWGLPEVNALYELGNAYARQNRFADADQMFGEALQANAGYDEIYFNVAVLKSARLGQFEKALDFYRMAWWINPLSPEVYNSFSAALVQNPSLYGIEACELLERATHFFPEAPYNWFNLGYLYSLQKRWPQAMGDYSQALILAPDMAAAERAIRNAAVVSGGPSPPILDGLARLRELNGRLKRHDFSPASLDSALRLAAQFPEMAQARFIAGSLLLTLGRSQEAIPHLEWTAAREPRSAMVLTNLANAYLAVGKTQDAVMRFRQALGLDPHNAAAEEGLRRLGLK